MQHYVTIPAAHLKVAKDLANRLGDQPIPMMAGPVAWFLLVDEAVAWFLLGQIPGAQCKTLSLTVLAPMSVEATPDAENILTPTERSA